MNKDESTLISEVKRFPSDPILLTGWPEAAIDAVESVLRDIQPKAIGGDLESIKQNPFRARLQRLSSSVDADELDELAKLEQAVAVNDRSVVILCLPDICQLLADELGGEPSLSGCEERWLNVLGASLRFQERDPERIFIVIPEDALNAPQQLAEELSARVGYQLEIAGTSRSGSPDRWRLLYQKLAALRVSGEEALSRASAELRSRRLFSAPVELESGTEWLAIYHEVESLRRENGLLVDLAHRLQSQLEDNLLQSGRDLDQLAELHAQLEDARKSVGVAEERCKETEADLATQLQALRRIRNSTSWRVTKPLRGAVNLVRRSSRRG